MPIDDPNIEESDAFIVDDLVGLAPHGLTTPVLLSISFRQMYTALLTAALSYCRA